MRLVRRNGNSMEDVVTRALHLRLRLRFASLILILRIRRSRERPSEPLLILREKKLCLSRYRKPEVCGSNPGLDTIFFLKIIMYMSYDLQKKINIIVTQASIIKHFCEIAFPGYKDPLNKNYINTANIWLSGAP